MSVLLPRFIAIAACDIRGVIGKNGTLPWHCPEDLQHFRKSTLGHVMIMGYKTFLSMPPRAFEGRTSFVFTKRHRIDNNVATQVNCLEELADIYSTSKHLLDKTQFVIGGETIFDLFFKHHLIGNALITHLHNSYEGDTYFPLRCLDGWVKETIQKNSEFSIVRHTNHCARVDFLSFLKQLK